MMMFFYLIMEEATNKAVAITEATTPGEAQTKIRSEMVVKVPIRALTLNEHVNWQEERFA